MKNERKQFESDMKAILRYIIQNKDLPSDIDKKMVALKECCDRGFIFGVVTQTMISGRIVCDIQEKIYVTNDGLNFLFPKKDIKFIISTTIAVLSILLNVILFLFG